MPRKTATPHQDNEADVWESLFALPESDYLDIEVLDRFLGHGDPNPARDWLLAPAR